MFLCKSALWQCLFVKGAMQINLTGHRKDNGINEDDIFAKLACRLTCYSYCKNLSKRTEEWTSSSNKYHENWM